MVAAVGISLGGASHRAEHSPSQIIIDNWVAENTQMRAPTEMLLWLASLTVLPTTLQQYFQTLPFTVLVLPHKRQDNVFSGSLVPSFETLTVANKVIPNLSHLSP